MLYKIIRMYQNPNISPRTIRKGLTLAEAQAHCRDPETSSRTCTRSAGKARTRRAQDLSESFEYLQSFTVYQAREKNTWTTQTQLS